MSTGHSIGHGSDQWFRSITAEHGHIRDVEVAVLEAIRVRETRAMAFDGP